MSFELSFVCVSSRCLCSSFASNVPCRFQVLEINSGSKLSEELKVKDMVEKYFMELSKPTKHSTSGKHQVGIGLSLSGKRQSGLSSYEMVAFVFSTIEAHNLFRYSELK